VSSLDAELGRRLEAVRQQNLLRELRRVDSPQGARVSIGGKTLLNFSSNDYLGLANHPALKEAAIEAVKTFGAGVGASRLVSGSLAPFHQLEESLADFKGTEAALTFSTGYATALGAITALAGKGDVIILDKLVHASIVDAAKLSGARIRVFTHNDLNDLEDILKWASARAAANPVSSPGHTLVITESIFSMDGDAAPLHEIVELKNRYGAWLMVDEAHATGLYGKRRRGLAEELGVSEQVDIHMGTLGKAIGAGGGYICGSRKLIDLLVNQARSFIFSTAPVPASVAAATAGIALIRSAEGAALNVRLWSHVKAFRSIIPDAKSKTVSAILPIIVGAESKATAFAASLLEHSIFVPAIRYPTVARNAARLRITLSAAHTDQDVAELVKALKTLIDK